MTENATLMNRAVAAIIDMIIVGAVSFAISIPLLPGVAMSSLMGSPELALSGAMATSLGMTAIMFIVMIGYFVYMEGTRGQTVGKMAMGIKVVSEDGKSINYIAALMRTVLRIIDGLPTLYIVGAIIIAVTEKNQRLGDIVAHTLVVKA